MARHSQCHNIESWLILGGGREAARLHDRARRLISAEMVGWHRCEQNITKLIADANINEARTIEERQAIYAKYINDPERLAAIVAADAVRAAHRELMTHAMMVARDAAEEGDVDGAREVLIGNGMSRELAVSAIPRSEYVAGGVPIEQWRRVLGGVAPRYPG